MLFVEAVVLEVTGRPEDRLVVVGVVHFDVELAGDAQTAVGNKRQG